MKDFKGNIIYKTQTVKDCLIKLNSMPDLSTLTLFVLNQEDQLVGTLTDGDVRRGFLDGKTIESTAEEIMHKNFRFLNLNDFDIEDIRILKQEGIQLVPILDKHKKIIDVIDFSKQHSQVPIDVVIMAGGEGKRLRPLTENLPKPLLKVGDKPILEHNIDRLKSFGINNIFISINYLGEKIENYFGNGNSKNLNIKYIRENEPLGTLGSISLINGFKSKYVLVMNSDLLTTIDFEDFYLDFTKCNADMAIATTPYTIKVPYAILETNKNNITSFKEKPIYSFYSNAGIYLIKSEILETIPNKEFYDATDLIEDLVKKRKKVISYPILGYWLDIGKYEDYEKAQEDIKHIKL